MALITYDDKSNSLPTSDPRRIYSADDANEVKDVVNGNYAEHAAATAALQAAILALKWKAAVKVATTANGTLASAFANGQTVDGVSLVTGDRILLKNQSDQTANGIYTVNASGAPTRATDADSAAELEGAAVLVQQGTANANTTWQQTTDGITLGSSNIVWAAMSAAAPTAAQVSFTPAGNIAATDVQAALEELDTEKTTEAYVDAEILANSLAFNPADELTEIAGLTLETDITVAQLLEALQICTVVSFQSNSATGVTITNMPSALTALAGLTFSYKRFNTTNARQMRLGSRVATASASVNNPRMFIQYSIDGGANYVTLGLGTIASGDAISLFTGSTGMSLTNWITVPAEAKGDNFIWRLATEGGDGAADPAIGDTFIEYRT